MFLISLTQAPKMPPGFLKCGLLLSSTLIIKPHPGIVGAGSVSFPSLHSSQPVASSSYNHIKLCQLNIMKAFQSPVRTSSVKMHGCTQWVFIYQVSSHTEGNIPYVSCLASYWKTYLYITSLFGKIKCDSLTEIQYLITIMFRASYSNFYQ